MSKALTQENRLPELLDTLRRHWKLVALVTVCFFAGATFYAERLPAEYDGQAVVSFAPKTPEIGSDVVRVILPKYVAYVTSRTTVERVASAVDVDPDELEGALEATIATDTGNLTIVTRLPDADQAADAANAFADEAADFSRDDELIEGVVVAPAVPPEDPSFPPRRLLEAAALLVGLLLGVSLAFLLERGRPRIRSWRDISAMSGYPVVGRIPSIRKLRTKPKEAMADPVVGSAFRTLRASLDHQWQDRTLHVITVTSPAKGEGKTTVAALFAESLARLGAKTLLIDADLRRPGLSSSFMADADSGLSEVLREKADVAQSIQAGWTEGLWVLPTRPDADAGDLLARQFASVLREARSIFEVIVVDTPPLLATDDSRTIASLADGVLLVIGAGTPAGPVNEAVLTLEGLKAPVLGAVGNRLREGKRSYY